MDLYNVFDNQIFLYNNFIYENYIESYINDYFIEEESNEQQTNLFNKIVVTINNIMKKIIDTISSIISRIIGKDNDTVEVPENFEEVIMDRKKWYERFGALISKIAGGFKAIGNLIIGFIQKHPIITTAMVASVILIPTGKYKKLLEISNSGFKAAQEALSKLSSKRPNMSQEDQSKLTSILTDARNQAEKTITGIKKVGAKVKKGVDKVVNTVEKGNKVYGTVLAINSYKKFVMNHIYNDTGKQNDEIANAVIQSKEYSKIVNNKRISDEEKKKRVVALYNKVKSQYYNQ